LPVQHVSICLGLEPFQVVKRLRNIAFFLVFAQDTIGAELDDLLGRKVKATIHRQETAKKRVSQINNVSKE
jgi:hypothetical protein